MYTCACSDATDRAGWTPLRRAKESGHFVIVDYFKSLSQQCKLAIYTSLTVVTACTGVAQCNYTPSSITHARTASVSNWRQENGPPPTKKRKGD